SFLTFVSPDKNILQSDSSNEASLVFLFEGLGARFLFAGDIGIETENYLLEKNFDLSADVLKVPHHGSRHSSGENFISAVSPEISVIGVGQNRFGHPDPRVLQVLSLVGSEVYRTDEDGNIKVSLDLFEEKTIKQKEKPKQKSFWLSVYNF